MSLMNAQSPDTGLSGRVVDENNAPISFANIILFQVADSVMAKAGYSAEDGSFNFTHITPGDYYLNISFVGFDTYVLQPMNIATGQVQSLGVIRMTPFAAELGEVVVASTKPIVEVKPDKTVFNVEGSVNSIGYNALELLRKAPGVVVDNNDRLMLIGKSGVKAGGKRQAPPQADATHGMSEWAFRCDMNCIRSDALKQPLDTARPGQRQPDFRITRHR